MTTRILLAESVHPEADVVLRQYDDVEIVRTEGSPDRAKLLERIGEFDCIGIRSRTQVNSELLERAERLRAVACFCIGTNQVDLEACAQRGIAVFNAPFANTRSVAELTLASVVMLMRGIPQKMRAIDRGAWLKTAERSFEVRGKSLGIVGYGNIGSQLSVLASGHGMHVHYFDIEPKLSHGNARVVDSLDELLEKCQVVTLHVPSTPLTRGMIDAAALARMQEGAYLINHARGDLVDLDALAEALRSGHLAGAAIDVFPREPKSASEALVSPLVEPGENLNVLLTPHIGGSTLEAQEAIGRDAAHKLGRFLAQGSTAASVNLPQVEAGRLSVGQRRLTCIHRNEPGFMLHLNEIVTEAGGNITAQHLQTLGEIGYAIADVEGPLSVDLGERVSALPGAMATRVLG